MSAARSEPFDIDRVMQLLREAVKPYPPAALFQLHDEGYSTPFEQLVACMISIRTRDETTLVTARSLFAEARTPPEMSKLSPERIDALIHASSFHENKAQQIHDIASQLVEDHDGRLPCDEELLLSFHGVGPKCANLVLGIACDQAFIGVDVHVHRVTNRWGYVSTQRPEQTMVALMDKLPRKYWVEINRLLVPFGKHICTGRRPYCSTCPLLAMCAQVGVEAPR
ncbi:MAG TPA: endonuclease III [Candidatus Binatia bacterium]|nr:endonuclease III [Candidatus Binatia bacterium]